MNNMTPEKVFDEDIVLPARNFIAEFESTSDSYCSFIANTPEEKQILITAMNNPDERLSAHINEVIYAKDLFCEIVGIANGDGTETPCPRIVIIDADGKSYQCVSLGIFGALKKIKAVYGEPTWKTPIPLKVKQIQKGERSILTLVVAAPEVKKK